MSSLFRIVALITLVPAALLFSISFTILVASSLDIAETDADLVETAFKGLGGLAILILDVVLLSMGRFREKALSKLGDTLSFNASFISDNSQFEGEVQFNATANQVVVKNSGSPVTSGELANIKAVRFPFNLHRRDFSIKFNDGVKFRVFLDANLETAKRRLWIANLAPFFGDLVYIFDRLIHGKQEAPDFSVTNNSQEEIYFWFKEYVSKSVSYLSPGQKMAVFQVSLLPIIFSVIGFGVAIATGEI